MHADKSPLLCSDDEDLDPEEALYVRTNRQKPQVPLVRAASLQIFLRNAVWICAFVVVFFLFLYFVEVGFTTEDANLKHQYGRPLQNLVPERPVFKRPKGTEHLQCSNLIAGKVDKTVARINYTDDPNLDMSCAAIKARNYFPEGPLSGEEAEFPIAIAKNIYTDYLFLEMELASTYSPINHYCFAIDKKSPPKFHNRIHQLADCFPNVLVTTHEFNVDSSGHNQGNGHFECLRLLLPFEWKYVVFLQNHDFAIKTNAERVQVYTWFGGANDAETTGNSLGRVNMTANWTFEALGLFKNATRNKLDYNGFPPKLTFAKGYNECTLSRAFADFIMNDLNITKAYNMINSGGFGIDEIFIPTLLTTDALGAPGGFTRKCINEGVNLRHFTRKSDWGGGSCLSHNIRHAICVFGVEDLKRLTEFAEMFANKMLPSFDWGAFVCWEEYMFNRTHVFAKRPPSATLQANLYLNHPPVRFHRERQKPGFKLQDFKCKL